MKSNNLNLLKRRVKSNFARKLPQFFVLLGFLDLLLPSLLGQVLAQATPQALLRVKSFEVKTDLRKLSQQFDNAPQFHRRRELVRRLTSGYYLDPSFQPKLFDLTGQRRNPDCGGLKAESVAGSPPGPEGFPERKEPAEVLMFLNPLEYALRFSEHLETWELLLEEFEQQRAEALPSEECAAIGEAKRRNFYKFWVESIAQGGSRQALFLRLLPQGIEEFRLRSPHFQSAMRHLLRFLLLARLKLFSHEDGQWLWDLHSRPEFQALAAELKLEQGVEETILRSYSRLCQVNWKRLMAHDLLFYSEFADFCAMQAGRVLSSRPVAAIETVRSRLVEATYQLFPHDYSKVAAVVRALSDLACQLVSQKKLLKVLLPSRRLFESCQSQPMCRFPSAQELEPLGFLEVP